MSDDEKPDINALLEHYGSMVKERATYMTRCVLHEDRTPSLSVNTDKEVWSCKSCGEGGDSYSLIMKKEGVDFVRARAFAASLGLSAGGTGGGSDDVPASRYGGRRKVAKGKGDRQGNGGYVPAWRRS